MDLPRNYKMSKDRGESIPFVAGIQTLLALEGFPPVAKDVIGKRGGIDGYYGKRTKAAVVAYQRNRGLKPDGIVGPKTWADLQTISVGRTPVLSAPIKVLEINDSVHVTVTLYGPSGKSHETDVEFTVDTGDFETLIPEEIAQKLGLKNLGNQQVMGVGGTVQEWESEVGVVFGGSDVGMTACIVGPAHGFHLWGLKFALKRNYSLSIDLRTKTLNYYAS